jgi:hypothetical protein
MRKATIRATRASFDRWLWRLGLLWWSIKIYWCKEKNAKREFGKSNVLMRVYADWRYAEAHIYVNVPKLHKMDAKDIDSRVIHELAHVLVNEMREGKLHHEERVVTQLTKAILWIDEFAEKEKP